MSMRTKEALAYALAKDVHAGQTYGDMDYFGYHVLGVARRFEESCGPTIAIIKDGDLAHVCSRCGKFADLKPTTCGEYNHLRYLASLLHDVVEDSGLVCVRKISYLFGEKVAAIVDLLTRTPALSYDEYIELIIESGNQDAIAVKIADLEFHLSQPVPRNKERYAAALIKLLEVYEK